jgi:hypothetical protein
VAVVACFAVVLAGEACVRLGFDQRPDSPADGTSARRDSAPHDSAPKDSSPGDGTAGDAAPWYDNSVGRRRLITIPAGKVSEDLPDFRLLVSLAGDPGMKLAETDGRDIFFTAGDGVTLHDYEIERIDTAQGMLDAWVRIPLLKASKDNHLYLYYDDPSASDRQNAAEVWKGCAGVWHLSDSPTAPPPQVPARAFLPVSATPSAAHPSAASSMRYASAAVLFRLRPSLA